MRSLFPRVRNAVRLTSRERRQALRALGWLTLVRAALFVVPCAAVAAKTARLGTGRRHDPAFTAARCSRAITRAARVFPGSTCLSQALAAECLLRRSGRAPRMTLGVAVDERRGLRAHAWLECDGVLVAGARDAAGYTPLAVRERP